MDCDPTRTDDMYSLLSSKSEFLTSTVIRGSGDDGTFKNVTVHDGVLLAELEQTIVGLMLVVIEPDRSCPSPIESSAPWQGQLPLQLTVTRGSLTINPGAHPQSPTSLAPLAQT